MCERTYILILTQKFSSMMDVKGLESSSWLQERNKCLNAKYSVQDDKLGPNSETYFMCVAK